LSKHDEFGRVKKEEVPTRKANCTERVNGKVRHNTGYKIENSRKERTAGDCVMCQWTYDVTVKRWAAILLQQSIIWHFKAYWFRDATAGLTFTTTVRSAHTVFMCFVFI